MLEGVVVSKTGIPGGGQVRALTDKRSCLHCSPDGQLLVAPAGCIERNGEDVLNTTYVFTRNCLSK